MLTLGEDQIDVFAKKATDDFTEKALAYVRDNFPTKFNRFGAAEARSHIHEKIDEAKFFGFETERQIISYIDLGMRFGRVRTAPWAQASLKRESGPATRRMRAMQQAALKSRGRASR